jgi:hypothetical protein
MVGGKPSQHDSPASCAKPKINISSRQSATPTAVYKLHCKHLKLLVE